MNVYVFFVEGFEEIEALTPVDILRRAGCKVLTISVTGTKEVTGGKGITIITDGLFEEYTYNDADLLILPGGPGTDNFLKNQSLLNAVKTHAMEGKLTAAICAAPKILAYLNLLNGIKATCYPGIEKSLHDAIFVNEPVVEDAHYITANGVGSALSFSLTIVKRLFGEQFASELARKVVAE